SSLGPPATLGLRPRPGPHRGHTAIPAPRIRSPPWPARLPHNAPPELPTPRQPAAAHRTRNRFNGLELRCLVSRRALRAAAATAGRRPRHHGPRVSPTLLHGHLPALLRDPSQDPPPSGVDGGGMWGTVERSGG